ncbi:MAG: restriction endonuclease subunit S [Betaproteobacteria bacterium HGW-Betaproteobacteria-12]|nr:MAG: restriction endonuclease subunit S [Betaproteobacteria bacterium HGW-Betaproteobacteria-12]
MKYAAYNEYKSSGSNWLDSVPSHWNVKPLKLIVKMPITDGPHETPEFIPDGVPFASVEAVWDGKVHLSSVRGYISENDHRRYGKKYHPKKDDILIVKSGSTTGKIAIVDFDDDFNVWSPLAAVRCDVSQACPEFVFYALSSNYFQRLIQVSWSFGTQPNIGMGVLGNLPAVLPPIFEQQTIARFLDAKTAQIDALVAQKRQLIAKLKEKRSALIARTVTRGLPPEAAKAAGLEPNPEMKDSGVEWLGRIPHLWAPVPLGYLVKMRGGATPDKGKPEYWAGEIPWVSPKDMKVPRIFDAEDHISDEGLRNSPLSLIPNESLLIVVRGMILAHSFPVALSMRELTINQDMKALVCSRRIRPEYLYWALCGFSSALVALADESAHGTKKIEATILAKFPVLVPPITEQQAITAYLHRKTKRLDQLGARIEAAVSRLTEYRQALITSVVTGKIDVRDWQSELEAA